MGFVTKPATRSDVMRNAESDSDDKEEYEIKRNKFRAPIYGPKPAPYLNCNNPDERSLAILTVTNPFRKITVWKKAVSFLGSLPVPLKHVNWKPDYKGSYTKEDEATGQWQVEIRLKEHTIIRPDNQDPNAQDNMKPWKRYCFHTFTMSFCYGKDVAEMQSLGCVKLDRMKRYLLRWLGLGLSILMSPFMPNFAMSFILLMNLMKLGLYQAVELKEEGFNVYFEGGLRNDDNFNAQDYWLRISREENLGLSRSHTSTIRNPILRVIHKMITYGLCQRTTGYDKIQKYDLWFLSMFDARHQNGYENVAWVITRWMKRKGAGTQKESQIFCGVPRVGIPRPPRASMQDLYQGVFEHMAEVYSVPIQGAYNPPGYAQPQYDQHYQQYPTLPPQYQQQQQDDDE
ncbi:hypothetical protein Tco_1087223 [Tanacetum coccineum]